MVATKKWALVVGAGIAAVALGTAAPAGADPTNDPCQLGVTFLCRFVPIAPELDHDIDLTQGSGTLNGQDLPEMPDAQTPEDVPPQSACNNGCA